VVYLTAKIIAQYLKRIFLFYKSGRGPTNTTWWVASNWSMPQKFKNSGDTILTNNC